jgi:hypothetical protein
VAENTSQQVKVRWENASIQSVYSNVCNVAGTREEIVLLFGMNQAFNEAENEMTIQLSNRIVMSPFVAKRLAQLLNNVVAEYETKYGEQQKTGITDEAEPELPKSPGNVVSLVGRKKGMESSQRAKRRS